MISRVIDTLLSFPAIVLAIAVTGALGIGLTNGMIAVGKDLSEALSMAAEVEHLCDLYQRSCVYGPPVLLSDAEMEAALVAFQSYGQRGSGRRA